VISLKGPGMNMNIPIPPWDRLWHFHRKAEMSYASFISNRLKPLVVMIFLMVSLMTTLARAEKARLTDIVATISGEHLLIYFKVSDCFTDEMKKAIENGINTTFTFFVTLYEVRDFQWDNKLADLRVRHDIVYDNLKKVFKVRLSERDNKAIHVEDFHEAKNLMSKIVGLQVAELQSLRNGNHYKLRMMAELDKIKLPLYLDYILFFLSLWDFETDWYTVNFTY
jgi:hypothetical protein